ncbi:hypothetical protein [Novosphingobium sp.]|uniref:hypothetical protein n=1 Tax=Novosphingobium sp. TaxID=1874826 RepID=UPI00286DA6BE|nr:hypothetical protein [Novosphingobium sp.]
MFAALLLGGCSSSSPGNTAGATDAAATGPAKRWDATNACAVIDKAAMSTLLGTRVADTSVAFVHQASDAESATSECTYILENGSRASVMLRWSPIADNNDAAIAGTRNTLDQTIKAFGGTVETVTGTGKAAFWVAKVNSLNVFIDDASFAVINVPSDPNSKSQALKIARRLGG